MDGQGPALGRSGAYGRSGQEIFNHQTRRVGGHASAHFEYHPNGSVSKVEVSDAPDGGIQCYHGTNTFDENGVRAGFTEQGHDNEGSTPRSNVTVRPAPTVEQPQELPMPQVQQVVECQKLFMNEVFLVNPSKWTCKVNVFVKEPSPALTGGTFTIGPRDTLRIGSYSIGESFEEPIGHVQVSVSRKKGNGPYYWMGRYHFAETEVNPEHRRYFQIVHGWTSTKKIW